MTHPASRFQDRNFGWYEQTLQQAYSPEGKCKMRSKFWWLTGFCNSHYVSHFAAFFIVVGTKTSVAESVLTLCILVWCVLIINSLNQPEARLNEKDCFTMTRLRFVRTKRENHREGIFLGWPHEWRFWRNFYTPKEPLIKINFNKSRFNINWILRAFITAKLR